MYGTIGSEAAKGFNYAGSGSRRFAVESKGAVRVGLRPPLDRDRIGGQMSVVGRIAALRNRPSGCLKARKLDLLFWTVGPAKCRELVAPSKFALGTAYPAQSFSRNPERKSSEEIVAVGPAMSYGFF